ncbi:selection and upkeep of intraepithelial T-cells protein 1 [Xenopus tropicalis]|uniref:Selection and upkeep of intraepithelial T-cells protein 1 n=1 Tax=Xenopus tropicalis TaxID=8364 RepID=A0A8J1IQL8_XENTR|nr:selection and upkeep of intraepithelial T-cells protein 1 [Xenopus tropicalis]
MIGAMAGLRITTIFTFMSLIITLQTSSAQRFDIKVTETPVIAPVGSDADLGCSLVPADSAESMTIKFHRGDPNSYVYVYNKNPYDPGSQDEKYKDRTEFLTENIRQGQVTLKIKNVQPSDTGSYTCLFVAPNHYSTGIVELQLAGNYRAAPRNDQEACNNNQEASKNYQAASKRFQAASKRFQAASKRFQASKAG